MTRSPCLWPLLNVSLFSGLLVCQLAADGSFNHWMLGICGIGATGNLAWFARSFRDEGKVPHGNELRSEDKSAIMSDLDKEIERRREIEKVEKN